MIDTAEEASLLGVHFKVGGAIPFFGLPVSELVNAHVDFETLWGRAGRELRERLGAASRPIDKFRVLEATLLTRLSGFSVRRDEVRFALDALGRLGITTVHDVTQRVGLSHRRFLEVFKAPGAWPRRPLDLCSAEPPLMPMAPIVYPSLQFSSDWPRAV